MKPPEKPRGPLKTYMMLRYGQQKVLPGFDRGNGSDVKARTNPESSEPLKNPKQANATRESFSDSEKPTMPPGRGLVRGVLYGVLGTTSVLLVDCIFCVLLALFYLPLTWLWSDLGWPMWVVWAIFVGDFLLRGTGLLLGLCVALVAACIYGLWWAVGRTVLLELGLVGGFWALVLAIHLVIWLAVRAREVRRGAP